MTLVFLGRAPGRRRRRPRRCASAARAARRRALTVDGPLWLPPRRPHVLTVALADPAGGLARIQAAVARRAGPLGRPRGGARGAFARTSRSRACAGALRPFELPCAAARWTFRPPAVTLYRSRPRAPRSARRYERAGVRAPSPHFRDTGVWSCHGPADSIRHDPYIRTQVRPKGLKTMSLDEKAAKARDAALSGALQQIERQFGKGSVMRMGDEGAQVKVNAIPTGALSLDLALGHRRHAARAHRRGLRPGVLRQDDARLPRARRGAEARRRLRVHRRRARDGPAVRPARSASTSTSCSSRSPTTASRRSRSPTCSCAPARSTWSRSTRSRR